jgi:selenocysteine lyase/cysteine desulfurase
MLSVAESPDAVDTAITALRRVEFRRLDDAGIAYLDYTGAGLYADRQIARHLADLRRDVLGNPHSTSEPSLAATALIDDARHRVLRFFDADPAEYAVIFTANCSAAIKLVAESYPFGRLGSLVLSSDNHNSVNGIREYARRVRAGVTYIPLDGHLGLDDPDRYLQQKHRRSRRLFAFPAQSNFSGVQHPLSLIECAQTTGFDVLLDAAAFVPSNVLSLREHRPEFVVVSFYKIFGYPTGVGALIARRDALARLNRPWFAGGAVNFVSVQNGIHELKDAPEAFEDGTPSFATLAALRHGFDLIEEIGLGEIHAHVARRSGLLIGGLREIRRHSDGGVRIYGPRDASLRGGTVAFNLIQADGRAVPYAIVERAARDRRIAVRGGCFCNPGAAEHAFGFDAQRALACLQSTSARGFAVDRFARCLTEATAVGAIRASVGLATNDRDVERLLDLIDSMSKR